MRDVSHTRRLIVDTDSLRSPTKASVVSHMSAGFSPDPAALGEADYVTPIEIECRGSHTDLSTTVSLTDS